MGYISSDKIKKSNENTSNISGISKKSLGTVEGKKVMIKGDNNKESFIEYFCAKLAEELNIFANKVDLIDCGEIFGLSRLSSVHYWEDNFVVADDVIVEKNAEYYQMRLFDCIVGNGDRHKHNYGLINHKLFIIDNGLSDVYIKFNGKYDASDNLYNFSIEKALENKVVETYPMIARFCKISDYKFKKMLNLPENLALTQEEIESLNIYSKSIYNRMRSVRKYLRAELKARGFDYKTFDFKKWSEAI